MESQSSEADSQSSQSSGGRRKKGKCKDISSCSTPPARAPDRSPPRASTTSGRPEATPTLLSSTSPSPSLRNRESLSMESQSSEADSQSSQSSGGRRKKGKRKDISSCSTPPARAPDRSPPRASTTSGRPEATPTLLSSTSPSPSLRNRESVSMETQSSEADSQSSGGGRKKGKRKDISSCPTPPARAPDLSPPRASTTSGRPEAPPTLLSSTSPSPSLRNRESLPMESQSSEAGSQPSDGVRKKGPRKDIKFKLHGSKRTLDPNVGLGCFYLEMSYDPKTTRFQKDTYPPVFLDVKDEDQIESLKVMKRLSHPNILEVCLINEVKGESVRVYVEHYTGVLSTFLQLKSLVNVKTSLIPAAFFREIVSEVVNGLKYLKDNGEYHGNFAWDTTFYFMDSSKAVTKLANLERKRSKSLVECQVADCISFGFSLHEISQYAQQHQGVPAIACCLIDDLASWLLSATPETLDRVMDGIKDRVFFWDEKRRKTFFAIEVAPEAWERAAFEDSFIHSPSMPIMPWTNQHYDGYLDAMEAYRVENGIQDYSPNDWKDFLRCISGMYTHQKELDVNPYLKPVDSSVLHAHPRLCLDLKAAMDQPDQPPVDQPDQPPVGQPDQPPVGQPDQPPVGILPA